mgnify:CR=1 FL=1
MYESRQHRPLHPRAFASRLIAHLALTLGLLGASLLLGIMGYMHYEQLPPIDAFLNASMLLGGMGPVNPPITPAGKLFAGCYALYAGLVFIVSAALIFTPIVHRVLHKFHWDDEA